MVFDHNKIIITSNNEVIRDDLTFTFPLFEIASCPTVKIEEVKMRRFNLIDRAIIK